LAHDSRSVEHLTPWRTSCCHRRPGACCSAACRWIRGHDGDEVLDEYKKIRSTKVDPGCCCAWGRPTATWTRSPSGFLSAVGVAGSPETVASPIIDHLDARADHVLVSAFGDLDSAVDQLEQLAPHSPTRSRAEPHPKAVALRCYRCSANVFSTDDVRRRVNGATHTTRMTNPIRTSTPTTPTMATNSGCIWTDTTGGSSDLPFSTKAAAPQPWSRAPRLPFRRRTARGGIVPTR
jgi:hypothetical protein